MRKILPLQIVLSAFILFGCSSKNSKIEHKSTDIYVNTYKVLLRNDESSKKFVGVVKEDISASISFPLNGNIEGLYVNEGQYIQKGKMLANLDPYSLENTHNASLATLKQAEDAMKRIQMLYDNKSLPEIQYIEMLTNLEQARSTEAIAQRNLNNSKLYAPFSGMVGSVQVEMGENVLPNQTVLTLLKINEVAIKISVPEDEVNQIQIGQKASVKVSATNNQVFPGEVFEKGIVADPVSHTYPIKIKVQNNNNLLLPGMVGDVTIANPKSGEMISVPNRCILKDGSGNTYVWKVVNGQAKKQIVQTGFQKSNGVEIKAGLSIGDEIIVDGYQKVSNGLKVSIL